MTWLVVCDDADLRARLIAAIHDEGRGVGRSVRAHADVFLDVLRDVGTPATTETCCDDELCDDEDWVAHRKGIREPRTRLVTDWTDETGQPT